MMQRSATCFQGAETKHNRESSHLRIAVIIDEPASSVGVISPVRRITGSGISDIKGRIESGRPVVEYALFFNDHEDVAGGLRELIAGLSLLGVRLRIYELGDGERLGSGHDEASCQISPEVLLNMLHEHDMELERQFDVFDDE